MDYIKAKGLLNKWGFSMEGSNSIASLNYNDPISGYSARMNWLDSRLRVQNEYSILVGKDLSNVIELTNPYEVYQFLSNLLGFKRIK